jgi:hypothetical protein
LHGFRLPRNASHCRAVPEQRCDQPIFMADDGI